MIKMKVLKKILPLGPRKGQVAYYASPATQSRLSNKRLVAMVSQDTSLSSHQVRYIMSTLAEVVTEALREGRSVELPELGTLRVMIPPRMMDSPEEVTKGEALKTPQLHFTPKRALLKAAREVEVKIDRTGC